MVDRGPLRPPAAPTPGAPPRCACPRGPGSATRKPGARRATAAGHSLVDRLLLLGRQLVLGVALAHLLHVEARLVAVEDRRDHDAGPALVEQRDCARLLAGQLVHRVVAHDRGVGDAAVHPLLGAPDPALEASGHLLDPVAQLNERLLEGGRVRGEVGLRAAEDRPLRGAHPPQLHGEHDHPRQRHGRDARGGERHDPLRRAQVVHWRQGTSALSG